MLKYFLRNDVKKDLFSLIIIPRAQACKKENYSRKSLKGALQDIIDYESKDEDPKESEDCKYLLNSELGSD